ncbi:hypothetical protein XM38_031050 [Halomicronema hongdechloris C2206]|uniref:Uncharacterized protein n=1 Tax=Halomicronema hongdechloris C2206 TaxID=1641165 RepID=A0A1Z3HPC3_9CYAN|nr:hypothetical protein XM38_031050 [Halomicronema hongdechloris C2206]
MTLAKASETALIRGHKRLEDTTIQLMQLFRLFQRGWNHVFSI